MMTMGEGKGNGGFVEGIKAGDEDGVLAICDEDEQMRSERGGGICLGALSLLAPRGQDQWWLYRFSIYRFSIYTYFVGEWV